MYFVVYRGMSPAVSLVRKLIAVFESIEKLPVYSYDLNGSGYGLQVTYLATAINLRKEVKYFHFHKLVILYT